MPVADDKLDDLILDDIDLADTSDLGDSELDSIDLSNFGDVETKFDVPHIKFDSKVFVEFLRVAKQVSSNTGRDVVSKSISILVAGEKAILRSTDYDTFFEMEVPIVNTDNVLREHIVIPLDVILKVTKAVPAHTVFLKRDDKIFIHLVGGELVLETFTMEHGKFLCQDTFVPIGTVAANQLHDTIRDLGSVVSAAMNPPERRVLFEDGAAYANYMTALVKAEGTYPSMDLKVRDIGVLRALLCGSEEQLQVSASKGAKVDRKRLSGKGFMYTFLVSEVVVSPMLKASLVEVCHENSCHVDLIQLYKMVELSAELSYSTGRVALNHDEAGNLVVGIRTKKDKDALFTIPGSKTGDPKAMKEPILLQSKLFKLLLRAFAGATNIRISLASKGVGIRSDKYTAALYCDVKS